MSGLNWDSSIFFGRTSAEMRELVVRYYLEPIARLMFEREPQAQSVLLVVAQYWSDEANDATHTQIVVTSERAPEWPECLESRLDSEDDRWTQSALSEALGVVFGNAWEDDNFRNIIAFASFCEPNCSQDMDTAEAYLPYAVVTRGSTADRIETEIVGEMLQPRYEDEFNVGYSAVAYKEVEYGEIAPLREMPLSILNDRLARAYVYEEIRVATDALRVKLTNSDAPIEMLEVQALLELIDRGRTMGPLSEIPEGDEL